LSVVAAYFDSSNRFFAAIRLFFSPNLWRTQGGMEWWSKNVLSGVQSFLAQSQQMETFEETFKKEKENDSDEKIPEINDGEKKELLSEKNLPDISMNLNNENAKDDIMSQNSGASAEDEIINQQKNFLENLPAVSESEFQQIKEVVEKFVGDAHFPIGKFADLMALFKAGMANGKCEDGRKCDVLSDQIMRNEVWGVKSNIAKMHMGFATLLTEAYHAMPKQLQSKFLLLPVHVVRRDIYGTEYYLVATLLMLSAPVEFLEIFNTMDDAEKSALFPHAFFWFLVCRELASDHRITYDMLMNSKGFPSEPNSFLPDMRALEDQLTDDLEVALFQWLAMHKLGLDKLQKIILGGLPANTNGPGPSPAKLPPISFTPGSCERLLALFTENEILNPIGESNVYTTKDGKIFAMETAFLYRSMSLGVYSPNVEFFDKYTKLDCASYGKRGMFVCKNAKENRLPVGRLSLVRFRVG
jgi:hypothetical protein